MTCRCLWTFVPARFVCMYVCQCVCVSVCCVYVCLSVCVCVCLNLCVYVCARICVCMCMAGQSANLTVSSSLQPYNFIYLFSLIQKHRPPFFLMSVFSLSLSLSRSLSISLSLSLSLSLSHSRVLSSLFLFSFRYLLSHYLHHHICISYIILHSPSYSRVDLSRY